MNQSVTAVTQRSSRLPWWRHALHLLVVLALIVPVPYVAVAALAQPLPITPESASMEVDTGEIAEVALPDGVLAAAWGLAGSETVRGTAGRAESFPMASLAKLFTVLVVLDAHPLSGDERGPEIMMDATDVAYLHEAVRDDAPIAPVWEGMAVTERDLIEWSLVISAGNAANSLARWAFGDIEAYLEAARAFASAHGLADTVIADAAGLSIRTVTTANDMLQISMLSVEDGVVLSSMQMPSVRVPALGELPNTNYLLHVDDIDAGKTGTLYAWGRNLVVTAQRTIEGRTVRLVGMIAGAVSVDDAKAAMRALLASAWASVQPVELIPAGTLVGTYRTDWGSEMRVRTVEALRATVVSGEESATELTLRTLRPGLQFENPGTLEVMIGESTHEVSLEFDGELREPDFIWKFTHPEYVFERVGTWLS